MLFQKKDKVIAIKLYSIGTAQVKIDRPQLVDSILGLFDIEFSELPKKYVIHGPYGVRKGGAVGIKSFKRKLQEKGHEKYYALSGDTESQFGFSVSFECKLEKSTYSEIVIWYNASAFYVPFRNVVKALTPDFSACSGFEIEIYDGVDVFTENKIKNGWLGGLCGEVSYEHLQWIKDFERGDLRDIFRKNLLSKLQLENALRKKPNLKYENFSNLFIVDNA